MFDVQKYRDLHERRVRLQYDLKEVDLQLNKLEQELQISSTSLNKGSATGSTQPSQKATTPSSKLFNADSPPSLTHTKPSWARVAGLQIPEREWNGILDSMVRRAKASAGNDHARLRTLVSVPFVLGRKEIEGYHFLADVDISVQGQDANHAWAHIRHTARAVSITIEIEFVWRSKPEAAFPGQIGRLCA